MEFLEEALAYDETGWPIWNSVVLQVPRKNGKTTLLAAYAVYRLLTSDGMPEILLAAASDKQAGRLFDAAATFVRRSPTLSSLCRIRDYVGEIVREDGAGKIVRLSSDPGKLHGYNPSLVICDELAQWKTPMLKRAYAALTSGGGARKAPQTFTITTAGEAMQRHDSILGRILDAALACEDLEKQPGRFVGRILDAKTLVWAYEAPTDDPRDTAAMKLANPASWITKAYLARQAANPELSDSDVLQLHGCVWAEAEDSYIPLEAWANRSDARSVGDSERIVLGFDGSYNRDATALIGCTLGDRHVFRVGIWERPAGAPDDWRIPRHEVDAAVDQAMQRYKVVELACDPPGWGPEIEGWQERYGDVVTIFETNKRGLMAPACDRFRAAVFEEELTHDGDEALRRHIANCATKDTPNGTVITKSSDPNQKIDAAVAAVVAFERASVHDNTRSVYESRGLLVI